MSILLNLKEENLITDSLKNKSKHVLKRFECNKCNQIYIYIVKEDTDEVRCNICDINMKIKDEI